MNERVCRRAEDENIPADFSFHRNNSCSLVELSFHKFLCRAETFETLAAEAAAAELFQLKN